MATQIERIQLKRGTRENLEAYLVGENKPLSGEPIYEYPDETYSGRPKLKIGDGIHDYIDLQYISGGEISYSLYNLGYYLNNDFYIDSTYTEKLPRDSNKIYVDLNTGYCYKYYSNENVYKSFQAEVSFATQDKAGILKLYKHSGDNEDGTMTQKSVTDGVKAIKFNIETSSDEDGDGVEENTLVLDLPW